MGVYSDTVSNMFYPYVKPQDTGNLTGVRWITVTNPNVSSALLIAGKNEVEASALHFTDSDLMIRDTSMSCHREKKPFCL